MRRNRLTIYADILDVIRRGYHKRTRIMGLANITWRMLTPRLEHLEGEGLIRTEIHDDHVEVFLTEKGRRADEIYVQVLEIFGLPVERPF